MAKSIIEISQEDTLALIAIMEDHNEDNGYGNLKGSIEKLYMKLINQADNIEKNKRIEIQANINKEFNYLD